MHSTHTPATLLLFKLLPLATFSRYAVVWCLSLDGRKLHARKNRWSICCMSPDCSSSAGKWRLSGHGLRVQPVAVSRSDWRPRHMHVYIWSCNLRKSEMFYLYTVSENENFGILMAIWHGHFYTVQRNAVLAWYMLSSCVCSSVCRKS